MLVAKRFAIMYVYPCFRLLFSSFKSITIRKPPPLIPSSSRKKIMSLFPAYYSIAKRSWFGHLMLGHHNSHHKHEVGT